MFRNQYDGDVTTFSPQGRLHQVEYAMEAVKQGSATIGLKSKTHAVLVSFNRTNPLARQQEKIIEIDDHVGISIAGLTADARFLARFMRSECYNSKYAYDAPMPISRLVELVGKKCQAKTQGYGSRPYGVGMLLAGYDEKGCHIFQTCPSANFFECKAMAIGARSQSAKTYLEKHIDEFDDSSLEVLIAHGLRALMDTLPAEVELSPNNCSIAFVGKDVKFRTRDVEDVKKYLELIEAVPMED